MFNWRVWQVCFYLLRQQVYQFVIQFTGVVAHIQAVLRTRFKAGHIAAILKYLVFTVLPVMMGVVCNFKMMNNLVMGNGYCIIFHAHITFGRGFLLKYIWLSPITIQRCSIDQQIPRTYGCQMGSPFTFQD